MTSFSSKRRMAGFSLVELLAGMMVALIAFVIMMKLFADSENAKRNVSSGSDAQINGAIALFSLGRELRFAGHGLTADAALGCTLAVHNAARSPSDFSIEQLSPVTIFPAGTSAELAAGTVLPAGDSNTDIIVVVYGDANLAREAIQFNDKTADANYAGYVVKNRVGLQIGDLVIAAESGKNCALLQVTGLPGSNTVCNEYVDGKSSVVQFNTATFLSPYSTTGSCTTIGSSSYNQSTPPVSYSSSGYSATLSNLGAEPKIVAYAIRNGNLAYCDLLTTDCTGASNWSTAATHIVGLKARFGWDTTATADGLVDEYSDTTPDSLSAKTDQCRISRISAVQIGLVARNALMDKQDVTSTAPAWRGGSFTLSHISNWKRYRYKVFETVVPLKNMVWKGAISGC